MAHDIDPLSGRRRGMWQIWAMHLGEQLKQLSAMAESAGAVGDRPENDEPGGQEFF